MGRRVKENSQECFLWRWRAENHFVVLIMKREREAGRWCDREESQCCGCTECFTEVSLDCLTFWRTEWTGKAVSGVQSQSHSLYHRVSAAVSKEEKGHQCWTGLGEHRSRQRIGPLRRRMLYCRMENTLQNPNTAAAATHTASGETQRTLESEKRWRLTALSAGLPFKPSTAPPPSHSLSLSLSFFGWRRLARWTAPNFRV